MTSPSGHEVTRILVVDDEEPVRHTLTRFLARRDYEVLQADSGAEAVRQVRDARPALVLLDIGLPDVPGTDVIPELLDVEPDVGIVVLSGLSDAPTVSTCMQRGALDYLTKPVVLDALDRALAKALRRRDTLAQDRELSRWLKREVSQRTLELEHARRRQEELTVAMLEALVAALEAKNTFLAGHSARVAEFAATISAQLGLPDDEIEQIRAAGRLHDLGMIGIRESVLDKHGPLTDAEYQHVKEHPVIGSRILAPLPHLGPVAGFVRSHHERWDGKGYPDGLAGYDIPLGGRIIHAAEIYDALTTTRPYQEPLSPDAAVSRMEAMAGSVLDPGVLTALTSAVGRRKTLEFVREDLPGVGDVPVPVGEAPPPGSLHGATRNPEIPGAVSGPPDLLAELAEARQAAEVADRAKTAFLVTMSHEIRTPMNGVLGMTEILLQSDLTAEQREAAELIRTSAQGLLSVVNDVLDFARIEAGRLDLDDTDFDLHTLAQSVTRLLEPGAVAKGVDLTCEIESDVPRLVRGDPGRLRQILTNLVGNAVKFTPAGAIQVCLRPAGPGTVAIGVRDTGVGIPADRLEAIFEEFRQVDASHRRRHGGSGLGLAITRRLVDALGGTLTVTSEVGRGSEFSVTIPFRDPAPAPRIVEPSPASVAALHGLPVLVVDDNAAARNLARARLTAAGADVTEADASATAVELLQQAADAGTPLRAVLLDAFLRDGNGFDLCEAIRQDPRTTDTRVVMISPAGVRGDADRCRTLGVDAYLTKPVSAEDVVQAIAAAVARPLAGAPPLITKHTLREGRRSLRILLAEDVEINQQVATKLLEKRGHVVDVVTNGLEAIAAVQQRAYDAVLMDIQMPEMDGITATRRIREEPRFATLPIIAMTAHALDSDRAACLAAGMNDYLAKPFRPSELFAKVERPDGSTSDRPSSAEPPVNLAELRQVLADEGMEDLAEDMLQTFLRETPRMLVELTDAGWADDLPRLADLAHALKSSAGAIRATALAATLAALEAAAKSGNGQSGALMTRVVRDYDSVVTYLRDACPSLTEAVAA
jgi:response regulator RpfG family c-di-GMP phosphodiesterase